MNETELADLRLAFRVAGTIAPRTGRLLPCWLAQFDERRRPCSGRIEAFHFIGQQRIRNALALPPRSVCPACCGRGWVEPPQQAFDPNATIEPVVVGVDCPLCDNGFYDPADLVLLAQWDPRNAGPGCIGHHRRLDSHATPGLVVPHSALPARVVEFCRDWGLESDCDRKYPNAGEDLSGM
jgi:hypothetical protein